MIFWGDFLHEKSSKCAGRNLENILYYMVNFLSNISPKSFICGGRIVTIYESAYFLVETDADKIRLGYSKFVTILLMIMLIGTHMLNNETLRIPKW